MTRDDIIRMAREAGFNLEHGFLLRVTGIDEDLERFAALVAAAERNKVAQWMIDRSYATGHGDTTEDLLKELEWQVRESEREACAQVCDKRSIEDSWEGCYADQCAADIRARGNL